MATDARTRIVRTAGAPADILEGSIAELFLEAVDGFQEPDALKYKKAGAWHSIPHRRVYEDVKRVTLGLEDLGVTPGDRVAILSENRPEWLLCDFACVMGRSISVPLYPVLPADQLAYMLRDSEPKVVFVSTAEQLEKIERLKPDLPSLQWVVTYEPPSASAPHIMTMHELMKRGDARLGQVSDESYRSRALETDPHDLLTVIYTSGTTGRPKGVMLTHNNLVSNVRAALAVFEIDGSDVSLCVLPLCHVFERMAGHYVMFAAGVTICYAESFEAVGQNLLEVRPTIMTLVPRGYEKIVERVEEAARQGGRAKVQLVRWARRIGLERLDRVMRGDRVGTWLKIQYRLADRLVFSKLRARTGGRMRFFVSGGAPLNQDVLRFFLSAGLTLLEGYGLTETSPVISFNRPEKLKIGTVGLPLVGVEVAIAEDGEILTRGPHVMKGYYKLPDQTAEVIDSDGWFHTGDIGELDEEGYLSVTDRKKEIIVTAGGKNIAPQPIENRLASHPLVNQVVMVGDRRKFPALLIVPKFEMLEAWAGSHDVEYASRDELVRDARVIEFVESEILGALNDLAQFERPKRVGLLGRELTVDAGEITPSLKIRRKVIEERYKDAIESLYPSD